MAFASEDDINLHLPDDKLEVDDARYVPLQQDGERVVRGYLAGHISPDTLATWTDPDTTPEVVRAITGRLIAAFYYRLRYSEDGVTDPQYAQVKYNEAIAMLQGIISGEITMVEVTDTVGSGRLTSIDFYPNTAANLKPYFTTTMNL